MGHGPSDARAAVLYRPRHAVPRACVVEDKPHIRTFICDMLDELGFLTEAVPHAMDIRTVLDMVNPSLIILSVPGDASRVPGVLIRLAAEGYRGNVMLFGGRAAPAVASAQQLGEKLRLAMLPPLGTPFRDKDLAQNLAVFLPIRPAVAAPIDVAEALDQGWLELWYQPKIDPHRLSLCGAEALIRMRHPELGIVPPAYFIPPAGDPQLRALSQFVIERAIADWIAFASSDAPIELAVNLPLAMLRDETFVALIRREMPAHPGFPGLVVEIDSAEVAADPAGTRHSRAGSPASTSGCRSPTPPPPASRCRRCLTCRSSSSSSTGR